MTYILAFKDEIETCSSSLLIGAETKGSCGPATKKKVRSTRARQCRPSRRVRAR